jgi:hypothetical protein
MWQVSALNIAIVPFLRSFGLSIFGCTSSALVWLCTCHPWRLPLDGLVFSSVVANLYVSSYAGTITSLQLSRNDKALYSLNAVSFSTGSEPNPSWLTLDETHGVVYCVDEGLSVPNGSISSYKTSASGKLTPIDHHSVVRGPVSSVLYNGGKALAVAH